jgi:NitT/TauT family transport system permease protein
MKRSRSKWVAALWPPIIPLVVVVLVLEWIVRAGWVPIYLIPPPSRVLTTLFSPVDGKELRQAAQTTALAALSGFALSAVIGIVIAIALSSARWIQRAFYPYAIFFQTVPIIAIAPLLVIWIGFDIRTVIASAFIVSVFPVIANTLSGLLSTDPALRDLFRLYGASHVASLLKLRLPFALPSIMTGLRVAGGLAVIGAIVGEFITGTGLGGVIDIARTQQRIDKIFAGLILAALLGICLFALVNLASWIVLRNWHASEKGES